ncbi:MAG: histidine phosphatase family protein, partial [Flavobacteriales bacterium]
KAWNDVEREKLDKWGEDYINLPCPGGESFNDMYERSVAFYNEIRGDGNIFIFSHGGVIRAILAYLRNMSLYEVFDIRVRYGEVVKVG